MITLISLFCGAWFFWMADGLVQDQTPRAATIFEMPRLAERLAVAIREQKWAVAEPLCRRMAEVVPNDAGTRYNLACILARTDRQDDALQSLEAAIERGFNDADHALRDEDLRSLRDLPAFESLLDTMRNRRRTTAEASNKAAARTELLAARLAELRNPDPRGATPAVPRDGQVLITEDCSQWNAGLGLFQCFVAADEAAGDRPIAQGQGIVGDLLRRWYQQGTAAGNVGDLYDNHDSDHSNMDFASFPQLTRVEFSDSARSAGVHHGLQTMFSYNRVTIGNSSTAVTGGPLWRSLPRLALTNVRHASILFAQYHSNQLYVYPEHRDHDPGINGENGQGHGDLYPCNTPYLVISQGSSGSDRVFLNAFAATLAAFQPEVKQRLVETGLLMPTLQRILRASMKVIARDEDYFSGKAHPSVFDGEQLDAERMIRMAHEMTLETIPPLVELRVIAEEPAELGRDYFDGYRGEVLLNMSQAVARVARSMRHTRRMVVAADSKLDGETMAFPLRWVILRGDSEKIKLLPRNASGSVMELQIDYHGRRPINGDGGLESSRVDIGVFAIRQDVASAPAFISVYYLDNERREYDAAGRIRRVDYADARGAEEKGNDTRTAANYVDPLISFSKDWRDEYHYDEAGAMRGWTRIRGEDRQEFNAHGQQIVRGKDGMPDRLLRVEYQPRSRPNLPPILDQRLPNKGDSD
jgi:hypothetical protein